MAASIEKSTDTATAKGKFKGIFRITGHGLSLFFAGFTIAFLLTLPEMGYLLPRQLSLYFLIGAGGCGILAPLFLILGTPPNVSSIANHVETLEAQIAEDKRKTLQRIEHMEAQFAKTLGEEFENLKADREAFKSRLDEIKMKEEQAAADELERLKAENSELRETLNSYLRSTPYFNSEVEEEEVVEAA